jgi:hypothetical protein
VVFIVTAVVIIVTYGLTTSASAEYDPKSVESRTSIKVHTLDIGSKLRIYLLHAYQGIQQGADGHPEISKGDGSNRTG